MLEPTLENDFVFDKPFWLDSGERLDKLTQRFAVYGELNKRRDNAVLVFHALTGSARVGDWWTDLIGSGRALDTTEFCFVCANYLGSCYGSTNEINTLVTAGDIVRAQKALLDHLEIDRLAAVIGGSLGGQLALQLAVDFPDLAEKCVCIAACELPALGLALNHLQREAVRQTGNVGLARAIAMLSYKSPDLFESAFARNQNRNGENPAASLSARFDVAGYLDYQSEKFEARFETNSYNLISKAMDLFEISNQEISRIKAVTTLVGISSDWLFPARDVEKLAFRLNAQYVEMISPDGHDAFLSDIDNMNKILEEILAAK